MSITAISTNGTKVSARNSASVSGNGNSEQVFMFKNSIQGDRLKKKNNYKKNLEQAKNENRLEYQKEEKFFFGLITREAEYTYTAKRNETIAEIRDKFNLKDGVLIELNPWIVDAHAPLPEGKKIFFREKDIIK